MKKSKTIATCLLILSSVALALFLPAGLRAAHDLQTSESMALFPSVWFSLISFGVFYASLIAYLYQKNR